MPYRPSKNENKDADDGKDCLSRTLCGTSSSLKMIPKFMHRYCPKSLQIHLDFTSTENSGAVLSV